MSNLFDPSLQQALGDHAIADSLDTNPHPNANLDFQTSPLSFPIQVFICLPN